MPYKAVIFDMDGTIVDTELIWHTAMKQMLATKGVVLNDQEDHELHLAFKGLAIHRNCQILKERFSLPDPVEQLIEEKVTWAGQLYAQGIRFIPGFIEFHKKVCDNNLKSGIATNADELTLHRTNQALKIDRFFGKHMYGIASVGNVYKPHPAIYLHAAEQLEVDPQACIAIEDSYHGLMAAKRAGMYCIGINTGGNRTLLQEAHLIVEGYHEISLEQLC